MSSNDTENVPNIEASLGVPGVTEGTVGDPAWARFINNVVQEINAKRVIVDTVANQETYDPLDGTLYVATDGAWAVGTGSEWIDLVDPADRGEVQDGLDTLAEQKANRQGDAIYPQAVTMHVRSDGDDANDGLTAADAKATVQSALDDAPLYRGNASALTIDIGDGTFTGGLSTDGRDISQLIINGNGDTFTTIDGSGDTHGIYSSGNSYVVVNDVEIIGGTNTVAAVGNNAAFRANGCTLRDGDTRGVYLLDNAFAHLDANTVLDQTGVTTGGRGTINCAGGYLKISGEVRGAGGSDSLLHLYARSVVFIHGTAVLEGDGPANTNYLVRAEESTHVKVTEGCTIRSGGTAVASNTLGANIKLHPNVTIENVNRTWKVENGAMGYDQSSGNYYLALPEWDGIPNLGNGNVRGMVGYNNLTGFYTLWSEREGDWLDAGRNKVFDEPFTFAAGEKKQGGIPGSSPEEVYEVHPAPASAAGTTGAAEYTGRVRHEAGESHLRWVVEETRGTHGGDCRVVVYKLQ